MKKITNILTCWNHFYISTDVCGRNTSNREENICHLCLQSKYYELMQSDNSTEKIQLNKFPCPVILAVLVQAGGFHASRARM